MQAQEEFVSLCYDQFCLCKSLVMSLLHISSSLNFNNFNINQPKQLMKKGKSSNLSIVLLVETMDHNKLENS